MRLAVGLASLALLAAACGGKTNSEQMVRPMRTFTTGQTRIVGALPPQTQVLRRILGELAPTQIAAVRVDERTKRWQCGAPPGSLALTVDTPPNIRADWDATLLVNLYFDAASRLDLRRDDVMLLGGINRCIQRVGVPTAHGSKKLAPLRRALASTGVHVVELRNVAGGVVVTVQTNDPAMFLRDHFESIRHRLVSLSPGLYVFALADASGEFVAGVARVRNQGESQVRPDLEACGGIAWSLRAPSSLPPCPA
jgi:hypothetical protein